MPILSIADMPIFSYERISYITDSNIATKNVCRYADIRKKYQYADIADADINIGTPLVSLN